MVAVAYRRWSFTRDFNCKALIGKILVFCIGGRLWEVVAYEMWSQVKKMTYFKKFSYLISSCIRKSITLIFMSFSKNKFTLL